MPVTIEIMTLQDLLRKKAHVESSQELATKLGLSRQHANGLWMGHDSLGLRLMRRMKDAWGISLDDLAEVDEAVPGTPRQRHPRTPTPPDATE
jgi:hypothetical protein